MKITLLSSLVLFLISSQFYAQDPNWTYIRRDNTGIGSLEHTTIAGDAFNNIWTGGYSSSANEGSLVRIKTSDTIYTNWATYNENYLPNGFIFDVDFDSTGIIWVATELGIVTSEDGLVWQLYDTSNTPILANVTPSLAIDNNDGIWAVISDNNPSQAGIAHFDGTTWQFFTSANSNFPNVNEIKDIQIDANNTKWIATDIGLVQYDGTDWTHYTTTNSGLSEDNILEISIDNQDRIWSLVGNAIDIFDGTTWTQVNQNDWPISNFYGYSMDIREDKVLLAGSNTTIVYFDGTEWFSEYTSFSMYDCYIDTENNYWVSGSGKVAKFDGTDYTKYTQYNTGLPDNFNNDIFIDSQGRKWFANGSGGIQVFDCPNWEVYGPNNEGLYPNPQPLYQTTIGSSISEDADGDIWFTFDGTSGYAIQIPDGNYQDYASWVIWDNTNSYPGLQFPEEIEATNDGKVFIRGSQYNTAMYDKSNNTWTQWGYNNGLTGPPRCLSAHGNAMYIGNYEGIDIYENGIWTTMDLTAQNITNVFDIKFDSNNTMWLATEEGLWRYDGSTWTNWNETNSNIAANHVTAIDIDANDTIYLSAHNTYIWPYYGGISYFDGTGNTFTTFLDGSSPLAHKQVEDIAVDSFGNIWALTQSEGFSIYNPNGIDGFECIDHTLERILSVSDNNQDYSLTAYNHPNPFSTTTTIEYISEDLGPITINIYDILGRKVTTIPHESTQIGKNSITIDLSHQSSGLYFCKLSSDTKSKTIKLVKN
ncbi:T9SS type A sorting domain-containing protein [Aequorivita flava]|uniref:T9SS type A sorting domain-containing protein n=1 Tax=Aequorivita flava TaxID=3114371 RepID=A0AB35YTV1_9FLAO